MTDDQAIRKTCILVVDDDVVDRRAVQRSLGDDYSVIEAEDGHQALLLLAAESVDCVLLDYNIPGTDTLTLVADLSRQKPVVVLTGQGNEVIAVALMKAGAQDYLSKDEFSSESLARCIWLAMEKAARRREFKHARERMGWEYLREKQRRQELETALQLARNIQQNLIPHRSPELDGFDISGTYLPADATGGDFFDYLFLSDDTLSIIVGDVSGHGLGPALVATEIRAHLRALAQASSDISQIATIANFLLWEDTEGEPFATLFFLKLDRKNMTATYVSAGHQSFMIHPSGDATSWNATAYPLGMFEETQVASSQSHPLVSGDILLLLTDGLTETMTADHCLFGKERCLKIVHEHRHEPAEKIIDQLLIAAKEFAQGERQHDDITIVVMKVL